jgi:hypothetical protein
VRTDALGIVCDALADVVVHRDIHAELVDELTVTISTYPNLDEPLVVTQATITLHRFASHFQLEWLEQWERRRS